MSDLLAIVDCTHTVEELLVEIVRGHADRVTLLVEEEDSTADWQTDDSPRGRVLRERVNALLAAIEARTGAVIVGLVASREQLRGWRFDRIVGGAAPLVAW
ncbi:hypothetical protein [Conexibacter sp. DBS9H8]|uniref:hypothetical protein n=1 Tax=Conexibacter sp. DBS9H8 TaxID=2937801 RepID=UPI00200E46E6|nr:hypothetical protein [Conexibacter sp. DBS9H8]